jgi:hypothetical protein
MAQIAVKFEQSEAVYAESKDPLFCFDDIIGIDLGSGQTRTLEDIVFPVDVSLGKTELVIGSDRYELCIVSVRIHLDKTNCDYVPGTRYGSGGAEIKATETYLGEVKRETKWTAQIAGKFGFAKQDVSISGEAERTGTKGDTTTTSVTRSIAIAQTEGAHAVRITMPEGIKGGLTGTVLSATAHGDSLTPYCRLTAQSLDLPVTGRIRVQARPSDMQLRRISKGTRGAKQAKVGEPGLRAGAATLEAQQQAEDQLLKEKVATLALLTAKMPEPRDPGQHVDLATKGFCFYPLFDEDGR